MRRRSTRLREKRKQVKNQDRRKLKRKRKVDEVEEEENKEYPRKRIKTRHSKSKKDDSPLPEDHTMSKGNKTLASDESDNASDVEMEDKSTKIDDKIEIMSSSSESEEENDEDGVMEFTIGDDDDDEDDVDIIGADDDDNWGGLIPPSEQFCKQDEVVVVDALKIVSDQQSKILDVAEALNVTVGVAGQLLKYSQWNNETLYQEFFDNKERLIKRAKINITNIPFLKGSEAEPEMECPICYDDYDGENMYALPCGHFFCKDCWNSYLDVQIKDGPSCLMSPCPFRGCSDIVGEELVKEMVNEDQFALYNRYLVRSFVDDNPKIKWCPAPDCGKAVFCPDTDAENVKCSCGQKFCFKCQREAHEPCSCEELRLWKVKEKDESETANWLTVNTKICPKCQKCIEKNGGCNHMSCSQCKHEFCWICMDDWKEHGQKTGGYYSCNKYKPEELKEKLDSNKVNDARAALEKYMHYFKRYAIHLNSQKFEVELKKKSEKKMEKLQRIHKYSSWSDVEYIQEAIDSLIECRRVLKYTYIHAYYLKDEGNNLKSLFEFLQQDLENETERLSGLLEMEIEDYQKEKIMNSSKLAKKRLEHLLSGVKAGLLAY